MTIHNTEKIPVWLDCDPGQDDTVAIIVACYSNLFELVGISTVHGNVSLEHTTCNALRVLTAIGKLNIPVYPGEEKPLNHYREVHASNVHGKTGLNGSNLLPISRIEPQNKDDTYDALARAIEKHEGRLNIVAIGPLTNMAIFFRKYPNLRSKINWISIMGGGFKKSNIKNAEFNFYCDPFAAKEIIDDEILSRKMILASLDITSNVYITPEIQNKILKSEVVEEASNFRAMMFELTDSFNKRMLAQNLPHYRGPVIHDPVALIGLAQLMHKTNKVKLDYERLQFTVSTEPGTYGLITSVVPNEANGIYVLTDLDVDQFWNVVLNAYDHADKYAYMNKVSRAELVRENVELESTNA